MDSTMPRRPEDNENWGGARPGAGKPRKPPTERAVTLPIYVSAALKERYTALSEEQRKAIRTDIARIFEKMVAEREE